MAAPDMSDVTTHGVRVGATAFYLPAESQPDEKEFVFGYRILIINHSDKTIQLMSRHWIIIDGDGHRREVQGDGVVGEQPTLKPNQGFRYTSFARLKTHWGTMEGTYDMRAEDGEQFQVDIGRFWLTRDREIPSDPSEPVDHPAPEG